MSGRSAYVRKEKTQEKSKKKVATDGELNANSESLHSSPSILSDFPVPHGRTMHLEQDGSYRKYQSDLATVKSGSSTGNSDDMAYARVKNPPTPIIIDSGIEKSTFRSLMDKKSEGVRKGLIKTFGSKKKQIAEDTRPQTAATIRPDAHELDSGEFFIPLPVSMPSKARTQTYNSIPYTQHQPPEYIRPGPPSSKLPPIPQGPQLKRWIGNGRPVQPWNKLRKDPELWDPNGDTLVFFANDISPTNRPPPSFRLSSFILEQTESRFLITLLREGSTEDSNAFNMPPSPVSSPGLRPMYPVGSSRTLATPPMSETSMGYEGQISYEIFFPPSMNLPKTELLRHQVSTRNVFAMLYSASLVGVNIFQTLQDLQERIQQYLAPHVDPVTAIVEWLSQKGIDDVRENPTVAAGLLAWSESPSVRWEEGWREAYVHCAGMHTRLETTPDYRFVTPITKALLERASLEVQVRGQNCEDRLSSFDFEDMWPMMSSQPPPARASFERLRKFFNQYYLDAYGAWPPPAPAGEEQWLTRNLTQTMQKDLGALYDYLVNRDVSWDCSEERSGRKWNIVDPGDRSFDPDTFDLPFTDLLVAFDNRHRYPHIPYPYPLVPESIPVKSSKDNLFKSAKKTPKAEDKMAERRAALAYTESTNIYLLGSDFVSNELVEAFVRFEKADMASEIDPFAARRGRWVLIYGILQTLASISVDTPNLRFSTDVSYHLNPRLRGTPPWKGANQNVEEASHVGSYCWTIRDSWIVDAPVPNLHPGNSVSCDASRGPASYTASSAPSIISDSDAGSSRPPFSPLSSRSRAPRSHRLTSNSDVGSNPITPAYGPGIQKLGEWPIRGESQIPVGRQRDPPANATLHKDFMKLSHSENDIDQKQFSQDRKQFSKDTFLNYQQQPLKAFEHKQYLVDQKRFSKDFSIRDFDQHYDF